MVRIFSWYTSFYKNANINITAFENKGAGPENLQILCTYRESQPETKKSNPPYLPNGDSVGKCFYIIGFITLENGGVGHLQIPKTKPQWGQNAHQTQKPQISYILQTWHF